MKSLPEILRIDYVRPVVFLTLLGLAVPAHANMQYQEYFPLRDSEDMKVYVWGLGKGLSWANTMLANSGRRMLFCAPDNFEVTAPNLQNVVSREAARYDDNQLPRVTIEQLLVMGLIRDFPCQGGGGQ